MTLSGEIALILRYFNQFGSLLVSGAHCLKVVDKAITSSKRMQKDRATPTV